ncbi:MAG TPA: hypothetical protein VLM40_04485, partial [Gemmata sp.]|nr:hypothetical protein [Gemmata sp.]
MFKHSEVPDSPLKEWDARWKLAALAILAFGIAALNSLSASAIALTLGFLLLSLARFPRQWIRDRLAIFALGALPFLLVLPITLQTDGPGWDLGPLRISERG